MAKIIPHCGIGPGLSFVIKDECGGLSLGGWNPATVLRPCIWCRVTSGLVSPNHFCRPLSIPPSWIFLTRVHEPMVGNGPGCQKNYDEVRVSCHEHGHSTLVGMKQSGRDHRSEVWLAGLLNADEPFGTRGTTYPSNPISSSLSLRECILVAEVDDEMVFVGAEAAGDFFSFGGRDFDVNERTDLEDFNFLTDAFFESVSRSSSTKP